MNRIPGMKQNTNGRDMGKPGQPDIIMERQTGFRVEQMMQDTMMTNEHHNKRLTGLGCNVEIEDNKPVIQWLSLSDTYNVSPINNYNLLYQPNMTLKFSMLTNKHSIVILANNNFLGEVYHGSINAKNSVISCKNMEADEIYAVDTQIFTETLKVRKITGCNITLVVNENCECLETFHVKNSNININVLKGIPVSGEHNICQYSLNK